MRYGYNFLIFNSVRFSFFSTKKYIKDKIASNNIEDEIIFGNKYASEFPLKEKNTNIDENTNPKITLIVLLNFIIFSF